MKDAELIQFATEFREGILDGEASNMRCAMVCWPLAGLLRVYGVECETIESDLGEMNHIWIRLADGRALDPTLDQFNCWFNENLPPVYLGPPTKYHATTTSPSSSYFAAIST